MASAIQFPEELSVSPMPFIALTGLDVTYNAVHRSIWDAFSNNRRQDRLNLSFACLEGDHQYPQCKPKRTAYDWYIPKGLLKSGWIKKHLYEVPSVVVVFFELDWDDTAWRERHLACASRVEVVRTSLQTRNTKVAVVLIQKSSPLPPGEDMVAAERAAALCSACNLSGKSLFVLPHTDHLLGYIIRLENAFYELAQSYYHTECRRVKAHKEFLNKTTHQLLFPRHQFKIAFLSEMMQDSETALLHYQQSYNHIHELRLHDSNNLELKVVGGYVNYKICKLCFLKLNIPVDAIAQFQHHVDLFKPLCGNAELLFEHSAWLSKQFLIFADLFAEAISVVRLSAVQVQHPGFYYQRAAHYAQIRKSLAFKLKVIKNQPYPSSDPLHCEKLEYFGQRPWRQGHQRIDLSDTSHEKEGILALKLKELEVDHSQLIIPLLSSAVSQFKKFHCPRLKRYLTIDMGKEYFFAKDFEKAMALLKRATSEYREGHWSLILTHLLVLLLDCAYITADINGYCTFSSELLGPMSQLPFSHKTTVQENILKIISGTLPSHKFVGPTLDESFNVPEVMKSQNVIEKWNSIFSKPVTSCVVGVEKLKPFVDCKVVFAASGCTLESCLQLFVCINVSCPKPILFSELYLSFSNPRYDEQCIISGAKSSDVQKDSLLYEPGKMKVHHFKFFVNKSDVSKPLSVQSLCLKICNEENVPGMPLIFKWQMSSVQSDDFTEWNLIKLTAQEWNNIKNRNTVNIIERESKVSVSFLHDPPMLVDEIYPIKVEICSNEDHGVVAENIHILASLKPAADDAMFQATNISTHPDLSSPAKTAEITCGSLSNNEKRQFVFYVRTSDAGSLLFAFQISYRVDDMIVSQSCSEQVRKVSCSSFSTHELKVDVVHPFKLTTHLYGSSFNSISAIDLNQPFTVMVMITSVCNYPIMLYSGKPCLLKNFQQLSGNSIDKPLVINEGETGSFCFRLVCEKYPETSSSIAIGSFNLCWKRVDSDLSIPNIFSSLPLPRVTVNFPALKIGARLPAFGTINQPAIVEYSIENPSMESKHIAVAYEPVENFIFSGPKQTSNFLPPLSSQHITFNLIPLQLGFQALPQLKILQSKSIEEPDDKNNDRVEVDTSALPTHLSIKPAAYQRKVA